MTLSCNKCTCVCIYIYTCVTHTWDTIYSWRPFTRLEFISVVTKCYPNYTNHEHTTRLTNLDTLTPRVPHTRCRDFAQKFPTNIGFLFLKRDLVMNWGSNCCHDMKNGWLCLLYSYDMYDMTHSNVWHYSFMHVLVHCVFLFNVTIACVYACARACSHARLRVHTRSGGLVWQMTRYVNTHTHTYRHIYACT